MKVCTDSCLFGAWIASEIEQKKINAESILDIGTGTGLLTLMLAQKTNAGIDAVEIDKKAFEQAADNITASPWQKKIKLINSDIKNFNPSLKYDLIICNPPFYENDLLSENERKNISKHNAALSFKELVTIANSVLAEDGSLAVLLPWHRTKSFENIVSQYSLFINEKILVKQTVSHNYFRTMLLLQKTKKVTIENELIIKNSKNEYSDNFKALLKDYYLYL